MKLMSSEKFLVMFVFRSTWLTLHWRLHRGRNNSPWADSGADLQISGWKPSCTTHLVQERWADPYGIPNSRTGLREHLHIHCWCDRQQSKVSLWGLQHHEPGASQEWNTADCPVWVSLLALSYDSRTNFKASLILPILNCWQIFYDIYILSWKIWWEKMT
jgi:hypothetical protein